jgi:hypothetical protein
MAACFLAAKGVGYSTHYWGFVVVCDGFRSFCYTLPTMQVPSSQGCAWEIAVVTDQMSEMEMECSLDAVPDLG